MINEKITTITNGIIKSLEKNIWLKFKPPIFKLLRELPNIMKE